MFLSAFLLPNLRSIVLLSGATSLCSLCKLNTGAVELVEALRARNLMPATALVESALKEMIQKGAEEVSCYVYKCIDSEQICLETETTNQTAMVLYENMGFIRYKRLHRYYLNAGDAFRFILPIKHPVTENIL